MNRRYLPKRISLKPNGIRVKRGHLDLLILEDAFGPGVMIAMAPGRNDKRRPLKLSISPVSSATIVLEALT